MSSRSACSRPSCWCCRREFWRRLPARRKWWDEARRTRRGGCPRQRGNRVSAATQLYVSTLVVYFFVNAIACWGLDLQFGVTGVLNFAFVVFQAAGAYAVALFSLGPASTSGGFQRSVDGYGLPFTISLVVPMMFGAVLAAVIGWVGLRRVGAGRQVVVDVGGARVRAARSEP